ncbi:MAG TPA: hypothetical protein DC024_06445 [Clostridiales bacterium]|jgi:hypothetical protein|nr:hypothetical protein [Clostridiales bacterium]
MNYEYNIKRLSIILMVAISLTFMMASSCLAATESENNNIDLASIQKQSKIISQKVLALVKEGKILEAENLPESKQFQQMLSENPALAAEYYFHLNV